MGFSYAYLSPGKYHQKENTMSNHPYPDHVVEAVAEAMGRSRTGEDWGRFKEHFIERTHVALQALWDASRVDTLDQLDELDHKIVVIDRTGHVADDYVSRQDIDHTGLPAHVIHWGDTDE